MNKTICFNPIFSYGSCEVTDLQIVLNCFGTPGCADLNCDGVTDELDVTVWECLFEGNPLEQCCPPVECPESLR